MRWELYSKTPLLTRFVVWVATTLKDWVWGLAARATKNVCCIIAWIVGIPLILAAAVWFVCMFSPSAMNHVALTWASIPPWAVIKPEQSP